MSECLIFGFTVELLYSWQTNGQQVYVSGHENVYRMCIFNSNQRMKMPVKMMW